MASIILKRGDERVLPHPLADLPSVPVREPDDDASCADAPPDDEPSAAPPAPPETTVEVLRQGGVATAVEVRCACGEVTVIEFDYAAEAARSDATEPDAGTE